MTWPQDLQGQQRYFAQVHPAAENALRASLCDEFSGAELEVLRDVLNDMFPDDAESEDEQS